ncbi:MAG: PEP-CTERM sorting domain-containing protein [Pirellulales bacterium]|nr:PEP-CTERM sorting domain-containing protein [Pirellulales bacterium]
MIRMMTQHANPRHSRSHPAVIFLAFAFGVGPCGLLLVEPALALVTTTGNVQPADPKTWTNVTTAYIGKTADGALAITERDKVTSSTARLGWDPGATGAVSVDGAGSTWDSDGNLWIGCGGRGGLSITGGGGAICFGGFIARDASAAGEVVVDGPGSVWTNKEILSVGCNGHGTLSITHGGLVSVGTTNGLTIDSGSQGDSFVNMSTGGMLALEGDADESLDAFLGLVSGTDAIRYWNAAISDWANITGAARGTDYTLSYLSNGDLAGYTLLTVGTNASSTPGDANRDGRVDATDAAALAASWLQQGGWDDGDFNADGWVNDLDLAILAANWKPNGSPPAVPEPGTLAMVATALAFVAAMIARRRGQA